MRHLRQIVLSLVVLGVTFGLWLVYIPSAAAVLDRFGVAEFFGLDIADARPASEGDHGQRGPAEVIVARVTEAAINDVVETIGDGRALRSVLLRAEVGGEVTEIAANTGGRVEAGSVILRQRDEAEQIAVERAQLVLADAQQEAERIARLETAGSVTEVRLREAQLALRTAELALREADYELGRRTIRAPFSGWLGLFDVAVGDRLSAQAELATLTDRSEILIDFQVPERVVGLVTPGMPIEVRALGMARPPLEGNVRAVGNVIDRASRTFRVQGRLANDSDLLRAGMSFAVTLRFAGDTVSAVDPLSVQWSDGGSYVWVVRNGTARPVLVTIRQRDADRVLVTGDLAPGDLAVVEGVQTLRPGAQVTVANRADAALDQTDPGRL